MVLFRIRVLIQDEALIMENFERSTLLEYLRFTRGSSVSDPRDQIYGILGLVDDNEIMLPLPDYSKSVVTVYTEFALALIANR